MVGSSSIDKKVLACTGESHIEHVEVVDNVFERFFQTVVLKTSAGHSAHNVAHSHQRQLVEGSRARLAPDEARERHLPVAERNDDVVIFQTLALVYAQQLYAVGIVGLYGQVAIAVVPLFKEPLYVGRVVYGKLVYDIEEGGYERALTLYLVELVKTLQMLGKLKERKG